VYPHGQKCNRRVTSCNYVVTFEGSIFNKGVAEGADEDGRGPHGAGTREERRQGQPFLLLHDLQAPLLVVPTHATPRHTVGSFNQIKHGKNATIGCNAWEVGVVILSSMAPRNICAVHTHMLESLNLALFCKTSLSVEKALSIKIFNAIHGSTNKHRLISIV